MKQNRCGTAMAKREISLAGAKLKLKSYFSVGCGFLATETCSNPMSQCQVHQRYGSLWTRRRSSAGDSFRHV